MPDESGSALAPIVGTVEPGFEQLRDSFERGFAKGELGAAVCVYLDGRKVVDLWGGWADEAKTREWRRDTIADTMSATKGMGATCVHRLVERGLLDLDEPVATYWPEFAQAGKENVTARMVLSHQAGQPLPAPVPEDKRLDWPTMAAALAQGRLRSEPGTRSEYLGATFAYLVAELVRRIDGRPLDAYFREEIAEPLGVDFLMAVGPDDDERCAELVGPEDMVRGRNTRTYRAANGHGSAAGLARVYAALARGGELDGVRVLLADTIEAATREQALARAEGTADPYALGYQLLWKVHPDLLPVGVFGHEGMGGFLGLADPAKRLGFGFVMNRLGNQGALHLLAAIYRSIG